MRSTNLLILRGYTGGAPKAFGNGRIAKVSVATNRSWIDKTTGDRGEKTDWVTVTILNEQDAKFALANVRKGSPIYAECRVAESSYQKDGRTIYGVDIVAEVFELARRPGGSDRGACRAIVSTLCNARSGDKKIEWTATSVRA